MNVVHSIQEVREIIAAQRAENNTIGCVPTMGALHAGHISLIERSVSQNDFTAISIFVNPLQFGPQEDLQRYPKTPQQDILAAEQANVDLLFHPAPAEILGENLLTFVDIESMQNNLCGLKRPGHFRGVCTIVAKLFNIMQPHRAYFGQKDIQQLLILQKMTQDLNFDIEIVPCPIVREPDGLAMSSRNAYLSPQERKDAVVLSRCIKQAVPQITPGETRAKDIIDFITGQINAVKSARIDYVSVVNSAMQDAELIGKNDILALAVYVGNTRLIDNHIIGQPLDF